MYLNDTDLSVELITAVNTVVVCAACDNYSQFCKEKDFGKQ